MDSAKRPKDDAFASYLDAKKMGVKSLLAKLMASEDISVIQKAGVKTAMFDVKNRVLVLPCWKGMTEDIYSLLIAHEVGHALFTPLVSLKELSKPHGPIFGDIVNICEDARIERKMKRRFAGLNRDFREGYKQMVQAKIFPLPDFKTFLNSKGEVKPMTFLDRLLLRTKAEAYLELKVPFTTEELPMVYGTEEAETWEQTLEVAKEIYDYLKSEKDKEKPEEKEQQEQARGQSSRAEGDDPDSDENSEGSGESDDSAESEESGGDDTEESDEGAGESDEEDTDEDLSDGSGGSEGEEVDESDRSEILRQLQKNISEMTEGSHKSSGSKQEEQQDHIQPECKQPAFDGGILYDSTNLSAISNLIPCADATLDLFKNGYSKLDSKSKFFVENGLQAFLSRTSKVVNHMVAEFNRKKAARISRKTGVAKKGTLDLNKLHTYKFAEDLFLSHTVVEKGKNHGLLLFLDMSGSMNNCFYNSVMQLLNLVMFCRGAKIPFEVFGFSDHGPVRRVLDNQVDSIAHLRDTSHKAKPSDDLLLINYLSSSMSHSEFNLSLKMMFMLALSLDRGVSRESGMGIAVSEMHQLCGTPLDAAIFVTKDIFWKFRAKHKLDIVHSIYITDGMSDKGILTKNHRPVYDCLVKNGPFYYRYGNPHLVASPVASGQDHHTTKTVAEILRDETGSRIVSIYLAKDDSVISHCAHIHGAALSDARRKFKAHGYVEVKTDVWDNLFVLNPSLLHLDAQPGQGLENQIKARPLLSSLIDSFATHGDHGSRIR